MDYAGLEAAFTALDLAARPDDELAAAAVRASSHARFLEERSRPDASLEPVRSIRFSAGGVGTDREITEAGYRLFEAFETAESVERAIAIYAEECEVPAEEVRRKVLDFVREALARLDPLSCPLRLVLLRENETRIVGVRDNRCFAVVNLWLLTEWESRCQWCAGSFFNRRTTRNPFQRSPVRGLGERPTDG